jgi:Ran GTPase-activating protein (RanGAP) involved in mRNA processing and transport
MERFSSYTANTRHLQFSFDNTVIPSDHLESGGDQSEILLSYPQFNSPLEIDDLAPDMQKTLLNYANNGIVPSDPKKAADIAIYCMEYGERKALLYLLSSNHGKVDALDFSWHSGIKAKYIELLNDVLKKLGTNTKLHDLSLAACVNVASPETIQAIAELIKNARTLKSLDLQKNYIQSPGMKIIGEALQNNYTLTSINLFSNRIGNNPDNPHNNYDSTGAEAIAAVLKNNHTLTSINLGGNLLYAESACILADALAMNNTLVSFDLSQNRISDQGAKAIATVLIKHNSLTSLKLNFCSIGETGGQSISHALINNSVLTFLDLSNNKLEIESASAMGNMLDQNQTLTSLDLGANFLICSAGVKAIAGGLENNKTLHILNLNFSRICNEGARSIASALQKNSSLTTLDLGYNNIGYEGAQALVYAMERNHSLNSLSLRKNTNQWYTSLDEENKRAINEYLGQSFFSKNTPITITHPDGRNETVDRQPLPSEVTNKILKELSSIDTQRVAQTMPWSEEKKSIIQRIQF